MHLTIPAVSTITTTVSRAACIRSNVRNWAVPLSRPSLEPQTPGDRSVLQTSYFMMDVSRDVCWLFLIFSVERRDSRVACWRCRVFPSLKSDLCINTASAGLFLTSNSEGPDFKISSSCTDWYYSWCVSIPSCKYMNRNANDATVASIHIYYNSSCTDFFYSSRAG